MAYVVRACNEDGVWMLWESSSAAVVVAAAISQTKDCRKTKRCRKTKGCEKPKACRKTIGCEAETAHRTKWGTAPRDEVAAARRGKHTNN